MNQRKENDKLGFWNEKCILGVDPPGFEYVHQNEEISGECLRQWRNSHSYNCPTMINMKASNNLENVHCNRLDGIRVNRNSENRQKIPYISPSSAPSPLTREDFSVDRKSIAISDTIHKSNASFPRSTCALNDVTNKAKSNLHQVRIFFFFCAGSMHRLFKSYFKLWVSVILLLPFSSHKTQWAGE
jgi:hypothetical protein